MNNWWETDPDVQRLEPPRFQAVAYYRHSAQDRQENSIPLQQEQVREWAADVRTRMSVEALSVEDAQAVYENARRYLKVQMHRPRFPGVILSRAVEAAIKGLHYERVMEAVLEGPESNSRS